VPRADESPLEIAPADDGSGAALELPRAGLPGWLVALTFVCIAVFVAGVVVYLRREGDSAPTPTESPSAGMVLVRKPDGTRWFLVDPRPVTAAAFRQMFTAHQQPGGPDDAVIQVSYNDARVYAKTRGGYLLTSDQWDAAVATAGVQASAGLFEWVESPDENKQVRQRGKTQTRPDQPQPDVTFRMAKPP
jgi:hypothetical protein